MNLITKIRRVLTAPFRSLRDRLDDKLNSYIQKEIPSAHEVAEFWGIENVVAHITDHPDFRDSIVEKIEVDASDVASHIEVDAEDIAGYIEVGAEDIANHIEVDVADIAHYIEVDAEDIANHIEVDAEAIASHIEVDAADIANYIDVDAEDIANHIDPNDIEVDYDSLHDGICYQTLGDTVFEGVKDECIANVTESIDVEEMKQEILHTINLDDLVERVTSKVVQSIRDNEGGNGLSFTLTIS
tara:strand:+ start:2099 stop:2827 length:729 start_codon:yes stop_codon:yes gene_type:complete